MKKIITTIAMAFTVMAIAHAQNVEIRIKTMEAEIPVVVFESYKKDFKGTTNEEWMIVPAALIGEEYVVTGFDNLNGAKPTLYTVTIKRGIM